MANSYSSFAALANYTEINFPKTGSKKQRANQKGVIAIKDKEMPVKIAGSLAAPEHAGTAPENRESLPWQIYDRIFKRIFNLSDRAIIGLINGLFHENFPPGSSVEYRNSEFITSDMDDRIADIFVTIAGEKTFHLEAQMTSDSIIILRVFEYGFLFARSTQTGDNTLHFPEPAVIYLNRKRGIPEKSTLHISFGNQGSFDYQVRNFLCLAHDAEDLDARNMAVLIPFQVLRLRGLLNRALAQKDGIGTAAYTEKIQQLQEKICCDIISSIENNLTLGNITPDDANQLLELTTLLHAHICNNFKKKGGTVDMKPLLPGAIELPNDKYRRRIDALEKELAIYRKYKEENSHYKEENDRLRKLVLELEAKQQT